MGDEQRVSWQELLAQSRDDFEAGTDFTLAVTFRANTVISRSCAENAQPCVTLRVRWRTRNQGVAVIARNYAVRLSDFVRKFRLQAECTIWHRKTMRIGKEL
jgi:hypothetical protein